jgi:hypothetical protein
VGDQDARQHEESRGLRHEANVHVTTERSKFVLDAVKPPIHCLESPIDVIEPLLDAIDHVVNPLVGPQTAFHALLKRTPGDLRPLKHWPP